MDTVELVKKLFNEAKESVPDVYSKVVEAAKAEGIMTAGEAAPASSGSANGASSMFKSKGFIIAATTVLAAAVAGVSIGVPLALNDNGESVPPAGSTESDGTGNTGDSGTQNPENSGTTPHTHVYGEWMVTFPATCTKDGEKSRECACGDKQTETLPAGHNFTEYSTDIDGHSRECTVCHETQSGKHEFENGDLVCVTCGKNLGVTEGLIYAELLDENNRTYAYYLKGIGTSTETDIVIASTYNGKPVMAIGPNAFYNNKNIKSVKIPDTVKVIDESAFSGCESLKSINFPQSITEIRGSAFKSTGLTEIDIPSSVKSIGTYAFYGCEKLVNINLPFTNIHIAFYAFDGTAFYNDPSNWDNGVLYCVGHLLRVQDVSGAFNIGDDVITVAGGTFFLTDITDITVSKSVLYIDSQAFRVNSELKSITVADGNPVYHSSGNCIIDNYDSVLIAGCKTSVIPDYVTEIGAYAFAGSAPDKIVLPDGVTKIGEGAFERCHIAEIVLPENLREIGDSAFHDSDWLEEIVIPPCVEIIGDYAFSSCDSLKTVVMYNGVKKIGNSAFATCMNLKSITIPKSVSDMDGLIVWKCGKLEEINFKGTYDAWCDLMQNEWLALAYLLKDMPETIMINCTDMTMLNTGEWLQN